MADKHPTQGMVDDRHKGDPGGTGIPIDTRGAGGGGPIGPKDNGKGFHGGQSNAAYHGHGRLGEQEVEGQENANSPSGEP
ncbi:hypothetical protein GCM10011515_05460 [Tsuneonella deserti]|uniref:Uncharacterized protein n=1 Tax=Tsuneonella deserti TaxID=2035528 RepID=A0ABQ1S0F3_9SPHN|nr:hypothetical protein [Tsuneonella deserti]GGD88702.1 hypothetical protein GCM10011515_05460 [Tsuneonella deserti]